ncbi:HmuY family protein [Chryseobacterium sp. C39-AII1]|uniref:HmuY family protein n=1 Tax=Chryseobacterium sp. C39-AII1 TaxID=3080332 RepID=UPI0032093886
MKYLKILSLSLIVALQSCFSADEDIVVIPPATGATAEPNVGGATEPNQVWIDLSDIDPVTGKPKQTTNVRTDWELGFYNGDEFRVIINGAIGMAVAKIPNATNINAVKASDVSELTKVVQIGTFTSSNLQYIDNPDGNFLTQTTGIAEIKANDADNAIYLVNMGRTIPTGTVANGSVSLTGDARGWKKIQILRTNTGYKLRYANLDDTQYQEYVVTKNTDYNFNFFSLQKGIPVEIQPKKNNWDIVFTAFTNEVFLGPGQSAGSYFYADFITTNMESGVGAYQVNVPSGGTLDQAYGAFKLSDIDQSQFIFNDHRALGDKWRTTTGANGAQTYSDRFFILKDAEGFFYKIRFNAMTKDGVRGYPNFEFEPL